MARRLDQRNPAGCLPDLSALAGHGQITLQRTARSAPVTAESLWNGTAARTHDGSGKHETGSSARGPGVSNKERRASRTGRAASAVGRRRVAGITSPPRRTRCRGEGGHLADRENTRCSPVQCRPRTCHLAWYPSLAVSPSAPTTLPRTASSSFGPFFFLVHSQLHFQCRRH